MAGGNTCFVSVIQKSRLHLNSCDRFLVGFHEQGSSNFARSGAHKFYTTTPRYLLRRAHTRTASSLALLPGKHQRKNLRIAARAPNCAGTTKIARATRMQRRWRTIQNFTTRALQKPALPLRQQSAVCFSPLVRAEISFPQRKQTCSTLPKPGCMASFVLPYAALNAAFSAKTSFLRAEHATHGRLALFVLPFPWGTCQRISRPGWPYRRRRACFEQKALRNACSSINPKNSFDAHVYSAHSRSTFHLRIWVQNRRLLRGRSCWKAHYQLSVSALVSSRNAFRSSRSF